MKDAYVVRVCDAFLWSLCMLVSCKDQNQHFPCQIDMEVKQQEMALDQQRMEQLMALQQQAAQQKAALEQQAMQLSMEYQQKKAEEEMQKQQYNVIFVVSVMDVDLHERRSSRWAEAHDKATVTRKSKFARFEMEKKQQEMQMKMQVLSANVSVSRKY